MASERMELLKLLFPEGPPKELESRHDHDDYVYKLGTYRNEELSHEISRLKEDRALLSEQTQELAVANYRTFIQTAECSKRSFERFGRVERKLDDLLRDVPSFEARCASFVERCESINSARRLNSLTLVRNVQLLEVLELPQLMDGFIRDNLYEDALELAGYVQRLYAKHPDVAIFKSIAEEVDKLWRQMLRQLLQLLRSDVQLPKCLQIMGHLRRMNVFTESELRLNFLQARDRWLATNLSAIPTKDPNYHLSKTIEITRVSLFSIITQYKAVFNDDEHGPLVSAKGQAVNQNCIFFCWLKQKITEFLRTLQSDLDAGVTSVDSYLGQCMYFGLSFSKVGCDFRPRLPPIFARSILSSFERSVASATRDFQSNMERFTLINRNHPKVPWKSANGDPMQPPDSILEFYPLAEYTNKLSTSFNALRLCAPLAVVDDVAACLEASLTIAASAIYVLYGQEQQAFTANARDAFTRLCMSFANDLVPYVQKAVHIIYPPTLVAQHLGVNVQKLQEERVGYLDGEKIVGRIGELLPAKTRRPSNVEEEKT